LGLDSEKELEPGLVKELGLVKERVLVLVVCKFHW
jgi:hypothetical protein